MQQLNPTDAEKEEKELAREARRSLIAKHLARFSLLYMLLVIVLGLALLPPLVNISRFHRRIASNISNSLGRPVHLDRVSLSLLPLPGFDIENLVVDEDPAFGAEPTIRANHVRATLRLSSLWRGHVECSSISFTEPSVNLVSNSSGEWNVEGVLRQASHVEVAPTSQRRAGATPRFPYIEATNARINFKEQLEKMPFSLVESEFALWAPDPNQWRLRLRARPTRTDASVSDTGALELEATLGRGDRLASIPLNLEGQWRDAPLGEASRVLTGRDAGWRGNMAISAKLRGTIGESAITSRIRLIGARRAEFVPQQPLSAEAECFATATAVFHGLEDLRCSWPPDADPGAPTIALTGAIPDIHQVESSTFQLGTSGIPAATLLNWVHVLTPGIADDLAATGKLTGSLTYDGQQWQGKLILHDATVTTGRTDKTPLLTGDVLLESQQPTLDERKSAKRQPAVAPGFRLSATQLDLGGRDPATLSGQLTNESYTLHLTGPATTERLAELARIAPSITAGIAETPLASDSTGTIKTAGGVKAVEAIKVDLISSREWTANTAPATWQGASAHAPAKPQVRKHTRSENQ